MCLVLYFQHLFSKYHALISGDHHYRNEDPFDEVSKDDDQTQGKRTFCKDPKMRKCIKGYFFIHLRNTDVRAAKKEKWEVIWSLTKTGRRQVQVWNSRRCEVKRLAPANAVFRPSGLSLQMCRLQRHYGHYEFYSFFFINSFASGAVLTLTTLNHLMNFLMKR